MTGQMLNRLERRGQAELPEPTARDIETTLVPLPQEDAAECLRSSAQHPSHQQLSSAEAATTLAELEEVLAADPRGGLMPAQLVDRKLLALLQPGHPGLCIQAAGRPHGIWRISRER
jgi:hypothetical protein